MGRGVGAGESRFGGKDGSSSAWEVTVEETELSPGQLLLGTTFLAPAVGCAFCRGQAMES